MIKYYNHRNFLSYYKDNIVLGQTKWNELACMRTVDTIVIQARVK
jgi:hypothetical protein